MKYSYLLSFLLIITLSIAGRLDAQTPQFVKGGFELTYDTVGCVPLGDTLLRFLTDGDVRDIGAFGRVYHGDTTCISPQEGNHFIGLHDDGTIQQGAFSMVLSNPLTQGKLYKITYYSRAASLTLPAIDVEIGYSTDSTQLGIVAERMVAPPDTGWMMQTLYFRPNNAAMYITVNGMSNTNNVDTGMIYLDNFSIIDATGISAISNDDEVKVMPNPATDRILVTGTSPFERDALVNVRDIAGHHMVCSYVRMTNGDMTVDVSDLPAGMYLLHITDSKTNMVRKIVIAR